MIKKGLLITLLLATASLLFAQDAYEIMKRVQDASSPKTTHALVQMILTDQKGDQSERVVEQWSAEDNSGDNHNIMVFHSPASVKNTRFLTKENQDRNDDQWIFLPALNRVRRIASSEGDSSFMGSEFTYHDMESRELDDYSYEYLGMGETLGYECYKVESRPKEGVDSPYFKTVSWIAVNEEINTPLKIEIYQSESDILKILKVEEIKNISGYWTPMRLTMSNQQNNRSTTLVQQRMELDKPVNTRRFSQRFLETGRTE